MKISLRILLINFIIVVLIISSAAIGFYSIMYEVLSSQQSRHLINSANNFIYAYRSKILETEDEFLALTPENVSRVLNNRKLTNDKLDFVLETSGGDFAPFRRIACSEKIYVPDKNFGLKEFIDYNPYVLILEYTSEEKIKYYYGIILSEELLNEFARQINSEVAVVWDGSLTDISNSSVNQKYFYTLTQANKFLQGENNFDLYTEGTESSDILATIYNPGSGLKYKNSLYFIIFTTMGEAAELRSTLKDMFILIGLAGIILSLILTFLFTDKLRKQLTELSHATTSMRNGNFETKIKIKSHDEIGKLGNAFNVMLDELEKKEKAKNEYSDFITLINQNPALDEISDAALNKIISTCGFIIGALYSVEDGKLHLISSYGIEKTKAKSHENFGFYDRVVENKESIEISSGDALPIVSTGMLDLEIKHLVILPIVYNNVVTSVLMLGSVVKPDEEVNEYLSKIKEQLAVGLTNAKALTQLEDFIAELKKLNDEYQKQNVQIKKQHESLSKLHNELKEQAAELEVQKQKAEESTKVKSQFLASMSHELRTPMNSILGLTELILEKADFNGKNKERLEVVLSSGRRLMTLINDILDLSKIEAGKMDIREEDTLVEELIEEVANSINPLVLNKKIGFNIVRNTNTKIIIHTDRGKIVQVLINLLGNAVKFTDEGSVSLQISTAKDMLKFDVKDTGIGIPQDEQKYVFEEFRQVDGSTAKKYGGTGLGLAICKKIAGLLGGEISVISKVGEGATFSFAVPIKFVDSVLPKGQKKINVKALMKNRKNPILIIDDDEEVRYTIGQYLTSRGYEVIFAEDGEKGIQMAIEKQPFAITLDVMLPKKDGWSVLKELKENPGTKDIPIIMLSILGEKNIGYGLGAFEYFVKPISADKILSTFSRLENLANKRIQKIVIVDDDELEFEKFKKEFGNDELHIEYIQDSEYAFNKIAEVQPDLVILDLMMPKIDGVTLSYKLKSNIKTKHIPILISTAKDLSDEERKSLTQIVEDIAVKSKGHPLDILKIVRDRIQMQEINSRLVEEAEEGSNNGKKDRAETEPAKELENSARVMIVDDDPDTLFTLDEIVQSCGCTTYLAENGIECLKLLEEVTPDLILLDIMMPEMDGFQTIKLIRENEKWHDLIVYAVTARAMSDDREIILKQGFSDFIPKPVNAKSLSFKIKQLITQPKAS
ncbi:MAG: response regulator [Ignavibacteriaceae bacterium]